MGICIIFMAAIVLSNKLNLTLPNQPKLSQMNDLTYPSSPASSLGRVPSTTFGHSCQMSFLEISPSI